MQQTSNLSKTPILDRPTSTLSPHKPLKPSLLLHCTNIKLETGQLSYYPKTTTFHSPRTFASETSAYPVFQCRYCGKLCSDPIECYGNYIDRKGNKRVDHFYYKFNNEEYNDFKQQSKTCRCSLLNPSAS